MAKIMKFCALIFSGLTVMAISLWYLWRTPLWFSLTITFGTCAYHFVMRLAVGGVINGIFHNQMNAARPWFQTSQFEQQLYKKLRLYRWKKHMPTYDPQVFSIEEHSAEEIVGAMCQAEVVHEVIVPLSFLPLFAAIVVGDFWVFFITSLAAAVFDGLFVMLQRYNRPRIIKILSRGKKCH